MALRQESPSTVTIPDGCRDDVVPLSDRRAEALSNAGVGQVALSSLVEGFVWPGPNPASHLVLATLDGNGRLRVGDDDHHLRPGTVAVCPAHSPRLHFAEEPWRVVTIRLADDARWRRLRDSGPFVLEDEDPYRFAAPTLGILGELPSAVTSVSGASQGQTPLDAFMNRFAGHLGPRPNGEDSAAPTEPFVLYSLALRMQLEALLAGPPMLSIDEGRLRRLWESVRREPGSDWSVEALARRLNVSRASLHRLVARHHRTTPGAIVDRIRMDHACRLLTDGDLPVKAIAAQVGYSTPYAFSAAFRRKTGVPPSKFRQRRGRHPVDT